MTVMLQKLAQTIKRLYKVEISEKELEELYSGKPIGDILGITKAQMDQFELLGFNKLEQKKYQDAYDIFVFLISLQPFVVRFHVNAGNAMQLMGQFDGAIEHYRLAVQLDVDYVPTYLNAALCYWMQGELELANDTLASGFIMALEQDDEEAIQEINDFYKEINGGDYE